VKYPKECPAFEVVESKIRNIAPVGMVVEGTYGDHYFGFYSLFVGDWPDFAFENDSARWLVRLKPLTSAAKTMLASYCSERSSS